LPEERYGELVSNQDAPPLVNIGRGEDMTVREVAELLKEVIGLQAPLKFDPSKPDGTPRKLMDITRLGALGWKPTTSLRAGLQATYEDFVSHRLCHTQV
jgi:GDP-L-fucose synthase